MSTLLYSPGIEIRIDTLGKGIIDVSEDIIRGELTLTENQSASLNFSLINHRRKYDGLFTPNDIVVVKMKRITWLPIFAGYLNQVPYFSVYPKVVNLSASDTLKRLRMSVWDAGSLASYALLTQAGNGQGITQVDGGIRDKLLALLTQVARWDSDKIHIGQIPANWAEQLEPLREKLASQITLNPNTIGMTGVVNGTSTLTRGVTNLPSDGPGTGALPAIVGRASVLSKTGTFSLSGEAAASPRDNYYLAMRWPYQTDNQEYPTPEGKHLTLAEERNSRIWWKNRKVLVVNPSNDKGVVLRAVEWGPAVSSGQVAELSGVALKEILGATEGTSLHYRFAPNLPVGPVTSAAPTQVNPYGLGVNPVPMGVDPTQGRLQTQEYLSPNALGEVGMAWKGEEGLQPHAAAARAFVKSNWNTGYHIGGAVVRNIAGTGRRSDHATGHAIDIHVTASKTVAQGAKLAMGNAIAMWFAANPNVFGAKYVIWNDRINNGKGWRRYVHPSGNTSDNTLQHRDHVHVSFVAGQQTQAGPPGNGWPGGTPADFNNFIVTDNGATWNPGGVAGGGPGGYDIYSGLVGPDGLPLLNAFQWVPLPDPRSQWLAGARALLNDTPLLSSVSELTMASMRSFMAAPNGDFMAWFPDYFGQYGQASKMIIRDIELTDEGFTIAWTDEHLVTHQFTAGTTTGVANTFPGATVTVENQVNTMGIATVEFPELMEALFNVGSENQRGRLFRSAEAIFQRFGARVDYKPMSTIVGPEAEFWYACRLFQKAWASQFSSQINLTFMPEIWPGMLAVLEGFKFQAYVEQVRHSFDFSDQMGFKTAVRVVAPSTTDRSGFYDLPLAGDVEPPPLVGTGAAGGGALRPL